MYEFNYDNFPKEKWKQLMFDVNRDDLWMIDGNYYGCVRIGDLCFDIRTVTISYPDYTEYYIDGDLYVGGFDDGYAYSDIEPDYPYTFVGDGADMAFEEFKKLKTYEEFKELFEERAIEMIEHERINKHYHTIEKAKQPLHVW